MGNFCKGCDVQMFFVAFLSEKGGQKRKIKWIFGLNVWSILNKDLIVL